MTDYKNLGGGSNVVAYEYDRTSITVQFRSGQWTLYRYTYLSAGNQAVEHMKELADNGHGLNSFIGRTRPKYESKK